LLDSLLQENQTSCMKIKIAIAEGHFNC